MNGYHRFSDRDRSNNQTLDDQDFQNELSSANQFTDEEIREQLNCLGFKNIPHEKFKQFKDDLEKLISSEMSMNSSAFTESHQPVPNNMNKPQGENTKEENLMRNISRNSKKVSFPDEKQIKNSNFVSKQEEEYLDSENDQSFASVTTTSSIVGDKVIKRKVSRKTASTNPNPVSKSNDIVSLNENSNRIKPSFTETFNETSETVQDDNFDHDDDDVIDELNFKNLDVNDDSNCDTQSDDDERVTKLNEYYPPIEYPVKSFIRSQSSLSNRSNKTIDTSRVTTKTNPMQKFHQYKKAWNKQKVPGEKTHNDLRWSIREQMLEKHVFVKKNIKPIGPNTYIVPTDKKRQQLRWMVRSSLANPI